MNELRSQFSGRVRVQHVNEDPEMTKQSHLSSTSIMHVIQRHDRQSLLTSLNNAQLEYGDVSEMGDYQDALERVRSAEEQFYSLPSKARKVFGNSAARFLDAAHDPDKRDLLIKAGLLPAPPIPVEEPEELAPSGE